MLPEIQRHPRSPLLHLVLLLRECLEKDYLQSPQALPHLLFLRPLRFLRFQQHRPEMCYLALTMTVLRYQHTLLTLHYHHHQKGLYFHVQVEKWVCYKQEELKV